MATIKDVAAKAGVSASTVSRVLNKGRGSPEIARRVHTAARELNYQINTSARGLKQRVSNVVGVIVADISNPPISKMFNGIFDSLHSRGFTLMLGNSEAQEQHELDFLNMFAVQRARGVVYTGKGISHDLAAALNAFPGHVVVATQIHERLGWPVVLFDNYGASYDMVSMFIRDGHRRIAFISGPLEDEQAGNQRLRGFVDALSDAGFEPKRGHVQHADFSVSSGYAAMRRLLQQSDVRPSVVYAASDLIAIGALRYLLEKGISVPKDLSLFGFDNIPVGPKMIPALSSVELDFYELGEVCGDILGRMFGRERTQVQRVLLGHRIIPRESYRPLISG
jgi:DNA-binding LacI/PurR family transcriptional regulator